MPSRGGFSKELSKHKPAIPLNLLNRKTDNQHAKQRRIEQTQYTGPLNLINMCIIGNGEEQVETEKT